MTRQRSFKQLVRTRMAKTGESYTAARAVLLAAQDAPGAAQPVLATSDETIRERTGRGWEEWFDLLDEWGAAEKSHRETARWVADQLGVVPLAWNAQAVVGSYERARLGRAIGQHEDGFTVGVSRTVAVSVERLYEAVVDESRRAGWLPEDRLLQRTATRPRSARFDWDRSATRVHVAFDAKGPDKSTIALSHVRLTDADAAAAMKAFWQERLDGLKARLEGGGSDA
ncbi:hypothetical protein E1262_23650 [Jiangella aurantiaca]|uniref:DUF4287 domain-containing protein n=1 Tax=Jiangella aurantiaca TaxID=2530373 RepID=A0A4R5A4F5_9ACTN|nr:hypothetical protein [Jiangella aurantiaca]TDD65940.1 hypothetical protein E1262_23650 [Jiangella aurantiaca]